MNSKEILTSIKELVGLSKEEVAKEVEATEEVILSTEVIAEEVIEEKVEEVELSTEETKEEVIEEAVELAEEEPKKEAAPAVEAPVQMNFATQEELSQVKQELLSMIKAMTSMHYNATSPHLGQKQRVVSETSSCSCRFASADGALPRLKETVLFKVFAAARLALHQQITK